MTDWAPNTAKVMDNGFGGSRNGDPINGVVIHHVAGLNGRDYVAFANSRNSHPTYHIARDGTQTGIVHPDRRPYSTAGRPDSEAVTFEIDNSSIGGNWPVTDASLDTLIDTIVWHGAQSSKRGFAKNRPGVVQSEFFIAWHAQYVSTSCPGPYVTSKLDYIVAECIRRASGGGAATVPAATISYAFGLTGEAQLAAQGALTRLGLYTGDVDGVFGPMSVKAFQTHLINLGLLPADYVVDGKPHDPGATTSRYGTAVQKLAAQHGYDGPLDGAPGPNTSEGIVKWAATIPAPTPEPEPTPPPATPEPQPVDEALKFWRALFEFIRAWFTK